MSYLLNSIIALLLILTIPINTIATSQYDVCVIGGGSAGMSSAVFLKDNGYNVLVLEQKPVIGGCCNTVFFNAPPGEPNWVDPGVQAFPNTTYANELGQGPWNISSAAFVQRFAGANSTIPIAGVASPFPAYAADFSKGISYGLQNSSLPSDFYTALDTLYGILAEYPWLDTVQNIPDPIPAALLIPFSEFIVENNLQPLNGLFTELIYDGAMGNYTELPTLYALMNVGPTTLNILSPGGGFSVYNGCIQIYNGIRNYLGEDNIITNANVAAVLRIPDLPITLLGYTGNIQNPPINGFLYQCSNLFVAFPPTLEGLAFLFPDSQEVNVFQNVLTGYYFATTANITGFLNNLGAFTLQNVNLNNPYDLPDAPTSTNLYRDLPYGPAEAPSYSNLPIDVNTMSQVIQNVFNNLSRSGLVNATLSNIFYHEFQPHFYNQSLSQSPSPYTLLAQLQGQKNTYYNSALNTFASSINIWDYSYNLVNKYFPSKNKK